MVIPTQSANSQSVTDVQCKPFGLRFYDSAGNQIDQIVVGHKVTIKQTVYYELFSNQSIILLSQVNATVQLLDRSGNEILESWNTTSKVNAYLTEISFIWMPTKSGNYQLRTNIQHCTVGDELVVVSYPHPLNVSNFGVGQQTPFSPPIGFAYAGFPLSIQEKVQNRHVRPINFSAVFQAIDGDGYTAFINSTDYGLLNNENVTISNSWNATNAGNYTISIFVVSNLNSPAILAEPQFINILLHEFCCGSPYPKLSPY